MASGVRWLEGGRQLEVVDDWKGEKATRGRRAEEVDGVDGQKGVDGQRG